LTDTLDAMLGLRGAFVPVALRAICFVLAILGCWMLQMIKKSKNKNP
jgi:hypothetical protein